MKNPHQILKDHWGYSQFLPKQEEIITTILNDRDTISLLPTGGGKSVCFQIPALVKEGICIVVSPLVALMEDQVSNLKTKGIRALSIPGGISFQNLNISIYLLILIATCYSVAIITNIILTGYIIFPSSITGPIGDHAVDIEKVNNFKDGILSWHRYSGSSSNIIP